MNISRGKLTLSQIQREGEKKRQNICSQVENWNIQYVVFYAVRINDYDLLDQIVILVKFGMNLLPNITQFPYLEYLYHTTSKSSSLWYSHADFSKIQAFSQIFNDAYLYIVSKCKKRLFKNQVTVHRHLNYKPEGCIARIGTINQFR